MLIKGQYLFLGCVIFQIVEISCNYDELLLDTNPKFKKTNTKRFKREYNKNDPSKLIEALTVSEAIKQLMNNSNVIPVPKSAPATFPIYNSSTFFERLLNESRIRNNMDSVWTNRKPIPKNEINQAPVALPLANNQQQQTDKKNIVDVYKKLAADFQILQQYLSNNKIESTKKPDELLGYTKQIRPTAPTPSTNVQTKNMIMIENINGLNGNFTRITLLKRRMCEKKKEIDLPVFPCEGGRTCSNVKLQINHQDDRDVSAKKEWNYNTFEK